MCSSILKLKLKKFICSIFIQPLVENSILHGMDDVFVKLEIGVFAKKVDNTLEIDIIDNGIGMNGDQIEALKAYRRWK